MKKYFFTFGSGQLREFNVDPKLTMLVVEAEDENTARKKVFDSKIGAKFCTSYPYSKAEHFKEVYGLVEVSLQGLLSRERKL